MFRIWSAGQNPSIGWSDQSFSGLRGDYCAEEFVVVGCDTLFSVNRLAHFAPNLPPPDARADASVLNTSVPCIIACFPGERVGLMQRTLLKSKLHRATVTDAALHYEGSITIDQDLMDAADLVLYEQVDVLDVTNGARLTTYVIAGHRGSGEICINGAAAHLIDKGDLVIIASYARYDEVEVQVHQPHIVLVDEDNRVKLPAQAAPGR